MKLIEASAALILLLSAAFCASGQEAYLDPGPGAVALSLPPDELRALESQLRAKQSEFRRKLAAAGRVDGHSGPNDGPLSPDPTDEWRRYYREIHGKEWQSVQLTQYGQPYKCVDEYGNEVPCNQQQQPVQMASGHCRIVATGDGSTGSGTLIHKSNTQGVVTTVSHMFDGNPGRIMVSFDNGERFYAKLVYRDKTHDCAALLIRKPNAKPFPVDENEYDSGPLTIAGFGPGNFRQASGQIVEAHDVRIQGAQYPTTVINCNARPGDSGGGAFRNGRFVGVVWGQRDGQAYLTVGPPIRKMFDSLLPNRSGAIIARQDQVAPPGYRVAAITPTTPSGWQVAATPRQASYGSPGGYGGYNGNGNGYTNGNGYPPMQPPTAQPPAEHKHDDILQLIEQQSQLMIQFGEAAKEGNAIVRANIEITEAAIANMQQQVAQIQQQNQELKNDIKNEINVIDERLRPIEDNPPPTAEEILDEFDKRPIRLRVQNPRTRFLSDYIELRPGKDATIVMELEPKPAQ